MRLLIFIPVELIKKANKENWLRSLSYFVRMKSLYRNNTHYNFSLRSLASKINCSPACLSHHLKVLEEKKLLDYHADNITFAGLIKLQSLYKYKNIGVPVDFKNQHDILRGQIIRFNLSAQQFKVRKSELHFRTPVSLKTTAKTNYTGLSAKGTGNLFGLSKESGSRIRSKLEKMRLLSVIKKIDVLIDKISESCYWRMKSLCLLPSYCYFSNGKVLIQRHPEMKYLKTLSVC